MQTQAKFLLLLSKVMEQSFFSVSVVAFKASVGTLPRIKISFFLLSICTDELLSVPNIITFLPNPLPSDNG